MAKTLVVYYSQSRGNTKKTAREIASTLGGDRQETPMPAVTAWAEKLKSPAIPKRPADFCRRVLFYGGYLAAGLL